LSPSEDPALVVQAMKNIFSAEGAVMEGRRVIKIHGEGMDFLDRMHDQFRDRHIRGAARRLLLSGMKGKSTTVMFNRQAATAGVLALCGNADESPLGPIYVTIESKKLEAVIDWLTAYESG
jgi:uncharacterized protein